MAEVLAVGPGGMVDGKEVTMQVKRRRQRLFTSKYAGTEVKIGRRGNHYCTSERHPGYGGIS